MTQAIWMPDTPDTPPTPKPRLVDDLEIVRRIRQTYPDWQTDKPSQSKVAAIVIDYGIQTGGRPTCAPDRARRYLKLLYEIPEDQTADEPDQSDNPTPEPTVQDSAPEPTPDVQDSPTAPSRKTRQHVWVAYLLALPAFVAIWSGWVGLGRLTGFGPVNLLPGTPWADWQLDTSITLPIGMEAYAAWALSVWLSGDVPDKARRFAKLSALGSLGVGMSGQVAYHLLTAAHVTKAHWTITMLVACLPVAILGLGASLAHLIRSDRD